ncbi:MAG: hypothetical protein JJU40_09730 [Rhodobacteraceae bacterium]|nr:hypothetical protein [Paracoccaceae bacterium]
MSDAVFVPVVLVFLVASLALLYPFRPFRTRKRAGLVMLVAFGLVMATVPPEPGETGTQVAALGGGSMTDAATAPARAASEPAAAALQSAERAVAAAGAGRWAEATRHKEAAIRGGIAEDELRSRIEAAALSHVRPLPASELDANRAGYAFLAALLPEEPLHAAARDRYAALIEEAEARALAEAEASRAALLQRLRHRHDRVGGVTWISHPDAPRYTNSRSTVHLYMGQRDGGTRPWLRMKVQYTADRWLFVQRVEAWHDGVREPLVTGRFERDHDHRIWEWSDVTPDARQIEVLRSLAGAREAVLRFHGRQYVRDVTLSADDRRALREMLEAHEALTAR